MTIAIKKLMDPCTSDNHAAVVAVPVAAREEDSTSCTHAAGMVSTAATSIDGTSTTVIMPHPPSPPNKQAKSPEITVASIVSSSTTTATATKASSATKLSSPSKKQHNGIFFFRRLCLVVPYLIGIVWHLHHPLASVLTGDFKQARRWYIDENSLEPSNFQMDAQYDLPGNHNNVSSRRTNKHNQPFRQHWATSLCDGLRWMEDPWQQHDQQRIPCIRIGGRIDLAHIQPAAVSIAPVQEAIVLVVPNHPTTTNNNGESNNNTNRTNHWLEQPFYFSILQLLRRMSNSETAPWLAKTLLVISPTEQHGGGTRHALSLDQTVDFFLHLYMGRPSLSSTSTVWHQHQQPQFALPPQIMGAMIRQLIVLDTAVIDETIANNSDNNNNNNSSINDYQFNSMARIELQLLPQGRRGVLPNMDLVHMIRYVYATKWLDTRSSNSNSIRRLIHMHPYSSTVDALVQKWDSYLLLSSLPSSFFLSFLQSRLRSWLDLFSFETSMVFGPHPPHATALDRFGIDAMTIRAVMKKHEIITTADNGEMMKQQQVQQQQQQAALSMAVTEFIQRFEYCIRALSNLHERLHHSTSLYLLPHPERFVKHEEYLIPTILLIVPAVVQAVWLLLIQIESHFDWTAVIDTTITTLQATAVFSIAVTVVNGIDQHMWWVFRDRLMAERSIMIMIYLVMLIMPKVVFRKKKSQHNNPNNKKEQSNNTQKNAVKKQTKCESIQFCMCLMIIFIHVPLAFCHVSLAFPSALLWVPIVVVFGGGGGGGSDCCASLSTNQFNNKMSRWSRVSLNTRMAITWILAVVTCPCLVLVPHIFPAFTTYICWAYLPLHLLFCSQVVCMSR